MPLSSLYIDASGVMGTAQDGSSPEVDFVSRIASADEGSSALQRVYICKSFAAGACSSMNASQQCCEGTTSKMFFDVCKLIHLHGR